METALGVPTDRAIIYDRVKYVDEVLVLLQYIPFPTNHNAWLIHVFSNECMSDTLLYLLKKEYIWFMNV